VNYQPYIVAILLFAMINGIFSPAIFTMVPFVFALTPAFFIENTGIIFYVSSLLLSTMTLIAGGVPAALYERWKGLEESTEVSMWIWMACTGILSLPAAINFFEIGL
jgi:energy-coupling factor transporter transmembrane protein EcfT